MFCLASAYEFPPPVAYAIKRAVRPAIRQGDDDHVIHAVNETFKPPRHGEIVNRPCDDFCDKNRF